MWKVLLQPCANADALRHYADTVETPVTVDRLREHLPEAEIARLAEVLTDRKSIPVWGVTAGSEKGNVTKWTKIEPGDTALFSGAGKIFASATVAEKVHNPALGRELWGVDENGETWEYIYLLDEVKRLEIPYAEFNAAVGYKPNFVIQGFNVLDEQKSQRLDDNFDLSTHRYEPEVSEKEFRTDVMQRFENATTLDAGRRVQSRIEQGYLRQHLFGNRLRERCCLCGGRFPVDMLVASHIKKRSLCSLQEQLDFQHNVVAMCLAGCDALFERGYVVINERGIVQRGVVTYETQDLVQLLANVVGRKCTAWTQDSNTYFGGHRHHHIAN